MQTGNAIMAWLDDAFETVVVDDTQNSTSDRDGLYRLHCASGMVLWVAGASDYTLGDVRNAAIESGMVTVEEATNSTVETIRVGLRSFPPHPYAPHVPRRF